MLALGHSAVVVVLDEQQKDEDDDGLHAEQQPRANHQLIDQGQGGGGGRSCSGRGGISEKAVVGLQKGLLQVVFSAFVLLNFHQVLRGGTMALLVY